jgi:hypothetical protein
MKRFLVAAALALCVAATLAPAVAAKHAAKPKLDVAFGMGVRAPSCNSGCPAGAFAFNASSDANGDNASGWLYVDFPGYGSITGAVTCLDVNGKWATLFGTITSGTEFGDPSGFSGPVYFVAVVHDMGKASHNKPSPDQMSFIGWDDEDGWASDPGIAVGDICANPFTAFGSDAMFSLIGGELSVVDK